MSVPRHLDDDACSLEDHPKYGRPSNPWAARSKHLPRKEALGGLCAGLGDHREVEARQSGSFLRNGCNQFRLARLSASAVRAACLLILFLNIGFVVLSRAYSRAWPSAWVRYIRDYFSSAPSTRVQ